MTRWIRKLLVVAVSLCLMAAGVIGWWTYFHFTDSRVIRDAVLVKLRRLLPYADVELGSAGADLLGGARLLQLTLSQPLADPNQNPVVEIPSLVFEIDKTRLANLEVMPRRIVLQNPTLRLHRGKDGQWNLDALIGPRSGKLRFAQGFTVQIRGACVELSCDEPELGTIELQRVDIDLDIRPPAEIAWKATIRGNQLPEIHCIGEFNLENAAKHVECWTEEPAVVEKILALVPAQFATAWADVRDPRGYIKALIRADYRAPESEDDNSAIAEQRPKTIGESNRPLHLTKSEAEPTQQTAAPWRGWTFQVQGRLTDGALGHPRLPYFVADLQAEFEASHEGLNIRWMSAECGPMAVVAQGRCPLWDLESAVATFCVVDIPLDEPVRRVLPERDQNNWDRFSPQGTISVKGQVRRVAQRWVAKGKATTDNLTVSYHRFPYRVKNIRGQAELEEDQQIHFSARTYGHKDEEEMELSGTLAGFAPDAKLDLRITGARVPLGDELLRALPDNGTKVVHQFLHMPANLFGEKNRKRDYGTISAFNCRIERPAGQRHARVVTELDLELPHFRYEKFPLPLQDVKGHLTIDGDQVIFNQCHCEMGGAAFLVDGQTIRTQDGIHLEMLLKAKRLKLDSQLRTALLDSQWQLLWDRLEPEGFVDVIVKIIDAPLDPMDFQLWITPQRETQIKPVWLPLPMRELTGTVYCHNQTVLWGPSPESNSKTVSVQVGNSVVELERLSVTMAPNRQSGVLRLENLRAESWTLDASVNKALPAPLAELSKQLNPTTPLRLELPSLVLRWPGTAHFPVDCHFVTHVSCEDCDLLPAVGLSQVSGRAHLDGSVVGGIPDFTGNLDIQSIDHAGFRATNLLANVDMAGTTLEIGNVRGKFYGGELHGNVVFSTNPEPKFSCSWTTFDARLGEYARESLRDSDLKIDGIVSGTLSLAGSGKEFAKPKGKGMLTMREADIFRLPVVVQTLLSLGLTQPDGQVFDTAKSTFSIDGHRVRVNRLELTSPVIDFVMPKGLDDAGVIDLNDGTLDMRLGIRLGQARGRFRIPGISEVLDVASHGLVTVSVSGSMTEPKVQLEPLTGIRRVVVAPMLWIAPRKTAAAENP